MNNKPVNYDWSIGDTVYFYYCDSDDLEWKIDCAKLIRVDQSGYWTDTSEKGKPGVRIVKMSPLIHSHTLEEAERKLPEWIEWTKREGGNKND